MNTPEIAVVRTGEGHFHMRKRIAFCILGIAMLSAPALAQNCSPYPYTLANGNTADASQVQANFNSIQTCADSNLAHNGANADITSLGGLTTPLSAAQGGTGTSGALSGDLSGSMPNPNVTSTHLTAPLPVSQGGTGLAAFSMTGGSEYTIASASTTNLGAATSTAIVITGTTTITSFGSSASTTNPYYFLRFAGSLTLVYSAGTMQLNTGGANYTTTAGDTAVAQYLGSGNWKVSIIPISGQSPAQYVARSTFGSFSTDSAYGPFNHGLGSVPDAVIVLIKCTTANLGYAVGDVVYLYNGPVAGAGYNLSVSATATTAQVNIGPYITLIDKGGTSGGNITTSDWQMQIIAMIW